MTTGLAKRNAGKEIRGSNLGVHLVVIIDQTRCRCSGAGSGIRGEMETLGTLNKVAGIESHGNRSLRLRARGPFLANWGRLAGETCKGNKDRRRTATCSAVGDGLRERFIPMYTREKGAECVGETSISIVRRRLQLPSLERGRLRQEGYPMAHDCTNHATDAGLEDRGGDLGACKVESKAEFRQRRLRL
jgi:hypothetical protein